MEQTTGGTLDSFLDTECCMLERTLDVVREVAPHATQRYPSISKVLVKSARHSVTMRAADNSPPTKTSRINPVNESVEAHPNGEATTTSRRLVEPFNDATTPENPYLLNFAEVESNSADRDGSWPMPQTHLRPPTVHSEVHSPVFSEVRKDNGAAAGSNQPQEPINTAEVRASAPENADFSSTLPHSTLEPSDTRQQPPSVH
ncbi:hypothetical protein DQ04_11221030 [Trypanosoma grayi]|uniref:hypothetical protein n=1 Tax=Trypanosoma grayi TaxID=71804 RepID=UPI0004F49C37|nr:hypothetical protein DQ04_11221030 [Trypanosoma grayi]KEG07021.1 hypothetical protein DQ04_11221030 [Trypanosoma grayi]